MKGKNKYITIDSNGLLRVLIPVVEGNQIGLENTCKSGEALKEFFGKGENIGAIKSIQNFKTSLEKKVVSGLAEGRPISYLMRIESLWNQASWYEKEIEGIVKNTPWIKKNFVGHSTIPSEFIKTIQKDSNVKAIGLDPITPDGLRRFGQVEQFSLGRGVKKDDGLSPMLRACFIKHKGGIESYEKKLSQASKRPDEAKWKAVLIKQVKNNVMEKLSEGLSDKGGVTEDTELNDKQAELCLQESLRLLTEGFKDIKSKYDPERNVKLKYAGKNYQDIIAEFRTYSYDGSLVVSEIIGFIKASLDWSNLVVFDKNINVSFMKELYQNGQDFEGNSNAEIHMEERMSIGIQFLLGVANIIIVNKGMSKENFGKIIEGVSSKRNARGELVSQSKLSKSIIRAIEEAIKSQGVRELENCILDWINKQHKVLGMNRTLTTEEQEDIIQKFRGYFATVKASPHFDEFLIRIEGEGLWQHCSGSIVTDLRNVLKHGFGKKQVDLNPERVVPNQYTRDVEPYLSQEGTDDVHEGIKFANLHSFVGSLVYSMLTVKTNKGDKLYVAGHNGVGQLGLGDYGDRHEWTEVTVPQVFTIEQVTAGSDYALLKGKGKNGEDKLYASGKNTYGQLGLGDRRNRNEWTEVTLPRGFSVEKVTAGEYHSFLIGKDKDMEAKLYACGESDFGQLGWGDTDSGNEWAEVNIPQGFGLEQVIVGDYHSFIQGKGKGGEDKLYASGYNKFGQLGLGDNNNRREWTEVPLPKGFTIDKVMAGGSFAFLTGKISGEDKLYGCGYNGVGQLGLGDTTNRLEWTEVDIPQGFRLEQVIAGHGHSFLKGKGVNGEAKLYACGHNGYGQLGLGDTDGRKKWTEVDIPQGLTIEQVIVGGSFAFLTGTVGGEDKLYAVGYNREGQLGLGDTTHRHEWTEVTMPKEFTIANEQVSINETVIDGLKRMIDRKDTGVFSKRVISEAMIKTQDRTGWYQDVFNAKRFDKVISIRDKGETVWHLKALIGADISDMTKEDLERKTKEAQTPMMYAVMGNNLEGLETMISQGGGIDAVDSTKKTALMYAVEMGNHDMVDLLLNKGVSVKKFDDDAQTALSYAVKNNQAEIAIKLLDQKVTLCDELEALKVAMAQGYKGGNKKVIQRLMVKVDDYSLINGHDYKPGANGRKKYSKQARGWFDLLKEVRMPKGYIAWPSPEELPKAFLVMSYEIFCQKARRKFSDQDGADIEAKELTHEQAMVCLNDFIDQLTEDFAVLKSKPIMDEFHRVFNKEEFSTKVISMFTDLNKNKKFTLEEVFKILRGNVQLKGMNIQADSEIYTDKDNEELTLIKKMMALNFDLSILRPGNSQSWVMYLIKQGKVTLALSLLLDVQKSSPESFSAFINECDNSDCSVLMYAAEGGYHDFIRVLIEQGGRLPSKDSWGRVSTLLMKAAENNHGRACDYFFYQLREEVNAQDYRGETALMKSAKKGYDGMVGRLLKWGSDTAIKDDKGRTALHLAALMGKTVCIEALLKSSSIDLFAVDNDGKTALDLAQEKNWKDVVDALKKPLEVIDQLNKGIKDNVGVSDFIDDNQEALMKGLKGSDGKEALIVALENNNLTAFERLLAIDGVNVNVRDTHGNPLLFYAVNNLSSVDSLLSIESLDVNAQNSEKDTLLHWAIESDQFDLALKLIGLKQGINVNIQNELGETALFLATECEVDNKVLEFIRTLLKVDGLEPNLKNNLGITALYNAVDNNNLDVIKALLTLTNMNVNLGPSEQDLSSPLIVAMFNNNLDIVDELLKHPSMDLLSSVNDPFIQTSTKKSTALHLAVRLGKKECVAKLLSKHPMNRLRSLDGAGMTAFQVAVEKGDLDVVSMFLNLKEAEIGLNYSGLSGRAPLFFAIESGHVAVVEKLLNVSGILLNTWNHDGESLLHVAAKTGNVEIVQTILATKRVDINKKTSQGDTPLKIAFEYGHVGIIRELLKSDKINVKEIDDQGDTILHLAAQKGELAIVKELIKDNYINVNEKNVAGDTPLHRAVATSKLDVVNELLKVEDIDVNTVNGEEETPLLLAIVQGGHVDIVKALLQSTKIAINDKKQRTGMTVLMEAVIHNRVDIIEVLVRNKDIDIFATNIHGYTALDRARYLCGRSEGYSPDLMPVFRPYYRAIGSFIHKIENNEEIDTFFEQNKDNFSKVMRGFNGQLALHTAVKFKRMDAIKKLLSIEGFDLNAKNDSSETALLVAVKEGYVAGVKELMKNIDSIDVTSRDNEGIDPLYLATKQGNLEIVKELLKSDKIRIKMNCFNLAVEQGNLKIVKELMRSDNIDINGFFNLAVDKGNVAMIKVLLESKKIDINQDMWGLKPLHIAVKEGYVDVLKVLLKREDIDLTTTIEGGRRWIGTALRWAIAAIPYDPTEEDVGRSFSMIKEFVKNSKTTTIINRMDDSVHERTVLMDICMHRGLTVRQKIAFVRELFKVKGLDVNIGDPNQNTVLHVSLRKREDHSDLVKTLLKRDDIDLNVKDGFEGDTPLHIAARSKRLTSLDYLLLDKRVEVNSQNNNLMTPLHLAAGNGSLEGVKALLKAPGINVNAENEDQDTPLHLAVLGGHLELVSELLKAPGIQVNVQNGDQETPLYLAVEQQKLVMVNELLAMQGINHVNFENEDGYTPLQMAIIKGNVDIVKALLLQGDIDVNSYNLHRSPLHLCIQENKPMVLQALIQSGKVDVNSVEEHDPKQLTALMQAVSMGKPKMVEALLKSRDIDIFIANSEGRTAIDLCARSRKTEERKLIEEALSPVKFFIDMIHNEGVHIDAVEHAIGHHLLSRKMNDQPLFLTKMQCIDGNTVLNAVIDASAPLFGYRNEMHEKECMRAERVFDALLELKNVDVNAKDLKGFSALHMAAKLGKSSMLQKLLKRRDIDVNIRDKQGNTALHLAVEYGHVECVNVLLASNIDVYEKNDDGDKAIDPLGTSWPISENTSSARDKIKKAINLVDELVAKIKNKEPVGVFIDKNIGGFVKSLRGSDGQLAWLVAAECQHDEAIRKLMKVDGVDLFARAENKNTVLHLVAAWDNVEILQDLLCIEGIDINAENWEDKTPLHEAVEKGNSDYVKALMQCSDLDINVIDDEDETALIKAVNNNDLSMVRLLVQSKAIDLMVNYAHTNPFEGISAFEIAVKHEYFEVCDILIKKLVAMGDGKNIESIKDLINKSSASSHFKEQCDLSFNSQNKENFSTLNVGDVSSKVKQRLGARVAEASNQSHQKKGPNVKKS